MKRKFENAADYKRQLRKELLIVSMILTVPVFAIFRYNNPIPATFTLLKNGIPESDATATIMCVAIADDSFARENEIAADVNGCFRPIPVPVGAQQKLLVRKADGGMSVSLSAGQELTINRLSRPGMSGTIVQRTETTRWFGILPITNTTETFLFSKQEGSAARRSKLSLSQLQAKIWSEYRNAEPDKRAVSEAE